MAINPPPERQRPYAATANVVGVLRRVRARNVPDRIDDDFLRVAGVPENVFGRVHNALRFLGLVEPDGRPSELLRSMSAAPEAEYRELLAGVLHEAYRDDFARVNPAEDTQAQIVDQFSPYQPRSQTARMVMLFLGLCREAGIEVSEPTRERSMRATSVRRVPVARAAGVGAPSPRTRDRGGQRPPESSKAASGLAGVTETDLAKLDPDTFKKLWEALGDAFYKSRTAAESPPTESEAEGEQETENG